MHLAIDINDLHRPQSGISRYICGLLTGMEGRLPETSLTLFHKDPLDPDLLDAVVKSRFRVKPVRGRSETWWGQVTLPRATSRVGADVLLSPAVRAPAIHRTPVVLTVHDLIFQAHPEYYRKFDRRYMAALFRVIIPRMDHLIAVSEATKFDLTRYYRVAPDRVTVIHHGIERRFRPRDRWKARRQLEAMGFVLPDDVVLFVGTLEPRKNVLALLEAVRQVRRRGFPHVLLIVGKRGWLDEEIMDAISQAEARREVQRLGHVPDDAIPLLYNIADVLAYPSLCEGFGFPVLEAMASGTPVVTSDAPGVSEVAGRATMSVDPRSAAELVSALEGVLNDAGLRGRLSELGLERAKRFGWDVAARRTLDVCGSLIQ